MQQLFRKIASNGASPRGASLKCLCKLTLRIKTKIRNNSSTGFLKVPCSCHKQTLPLDVATEI